MKTKEEMIDRYHQLYDKMKESKDPKNMKIFGEAEKYIFKQLAATHPQLADSWLARLEAVCWDNYLSEAEAMNISKWMENQDKTKGFHWPKEPFMKAVEGIGGCTERNPEYNSCALLATANMIYSDHARSIAEDMGYKSPTEVPNEKMLRSCYNKAVEKLCDADKGFSVRKYFKHAMYGDPPG